MNKEKKAAAVDILQGLVSGKYGPEDKTRGLCYNFSALCEKFHKVRIDLDDFLSYHDHTRWDEFTGDWGTPIPHPDDLSGSIYFKLSSLGVNVWDKRTTYGRSRWAYVAFCLKMAVEYPHV